ncbi:MAG: hypothetical protein LBK58_00215, partial [Prevotellaceae bacterium]|nr:hypothetical protein [Prevotellaceae bacterium]
NTNMSETCFITLRIATLSLLLLSLYILLLMNKDLSKWFNTELHSSTLERRISKIRSSSRPVSVLMINHYVYS